MIRRAERAMRVGGGRQAFEAAPAIADPDPIERVDKGGAARFVGMVEDEGEQPRRSLEITSKILVSGAFRQSGMEHRADPVAVGEPARDPERGLLVKIGRA